MLTERERVLFDTVSELVDYVGDWEDILSVSIFKCDVRVKDTMRETFTVEIVRDDTNTFVITMVQGCDYLLVKPCFMLDGEEPVFEKRMVFTDVWSKIEQVLVKLKNVTGFIDFEGTSGIHVSNSNLTNNETGQSFNKIKVFYKVAGSNTMFFVDIPYEEDIEEC